MKRVLVAVAVVLVALVQAGVTAEASVFCSSDPAIHFTDAVGHPHTVYLTSYGDGTEHSGAVNSTKDSYAIESSDGGHKTKVKLWILVPDDSRKHFHVRFVVSTQPNGAGTVLMKHDGNSGHPYHFDFDLVT